MNDLRVRLPVLLDRPDEKSEEMPKKPGIIAQRYGVRSLPSNYIIDKEGIL